jgi:hypothetical protein
MANIPRTVSRRGQGHLRRFRYGRCQVHRGRQPPQRVWTAQRLKNVSGRPQLCAVQVHHVQQQVFHISAVASVNSSTVAEYHVLRRLRPRSCQNLPLRGLGPRSTRSDRDSGSLPFSYTSCHDTSRYPLLALPIPDGGTNLGLVMGHVSIVLILVSSENYAYTTTSRFWPVGAGTSGRLVLRNFSTPYLSLCSDSTSLTPLCSWTTYAMCRPGTGALVSVFLRTTSQHRLRVSPRRQVEHSLFSWIWHRTHVNGMSG